MTDFICHFFATINVFSVSDFHCHWTCFRPKRSATYIQVLLHLQINVVEIIFIWCLKALCLEFWIYFWKKTEKKWTKNAGTNEESKQTELILIRRLCITTRWRNKDSAHTHTYTHVHTHTTGPDCRIIRFL